ncbi:MAG TPA: hypothetical protein VFQ61_01865 [Polyangiaceae bacterium]|nr:hypothetical protein [Polyangiaceae bacterium]
MKHPARALCFLAAAALFAPGAHADPLLVEGPSLPTAELEWIRGQLVNGSFGGASQSLPPGVSVTVKLTVEQGQWCARGSLSAWDEPTPEELEKRCSAMGTSLLGTQRYAPSHAALSRFIIEPLASDITRRLSSRWQLRIAHTTPESLNISVGDRDAKPYLAMSETGVATLSVKSGSKVTVSAGSCTRILDAATPIIDLEQLRTVRTFSPVWTREGQAIQSLTLDTGDVTRLTLRLDEESNQGAIALPCSGAISARIMGETFSATSIETKPESWTWSIEAKKSPGIIHVGLRAAEGQSDKETAISLSFEPPWWTRLWVKVSGALLGAGALLKGILEIKKSIQDLRGKKNSPTEKAPQE